jgi:hypothetical protein
MKNYRFDYPLGPTSKLVICFDYTKGRPGRMYERNGDPGYPDDPEELDITDVQVWHRTDNKAQWVNTGVSIGEDVIGNEWAEEKAWAYIEEQREEAEA